MSERPPGNAAFELGDNFPEMWRQIQNSEELLDAIDEIDDPDDFDEPGTLYQYWLSVADGTKVGGYPDWIQGPEWPSCKCGSRMEYLLTIASAEFDGGTWGRWLAQEERQVWGADYEIRNVVQRAANIMLGDMRNLNYFICRNCEGWPISGVFQCS